MSTAAAVETNRRARTALGTPRAESWEDDWLAMVDETEQRLGRRICGAHAPDGEPCELASTHRNGRCRFHGGHPRIGAQPGNTNALVHGLYSRRLRQCDATCPMWNACPFAGKDVMELGPRKRPVCAFESEAYAALSGLRSLSPRDPIAGIAPKVDLGTRVTPLDAERIEAEEKEQHEALVRSIRLHSLRPESERRIEHLQQEMRSENEGRDGAEREAPQSTFAEEECVDITVPDSGHSSLTVSSPEANVGPAVDDTAGILYAMLQRATLYVAAHSLVDHTEAEGERYSMRTTKVGAGLTAFLRIARELRAWMRLRPDIAVASFPGEPNTHQAEPEPETVGLHESAQTFFELLDMAVDTIVRAGVDPRPKRATSGEPILDDFE